MRTQIEIWIQSACSVDSFVRRYQYTKHRQMHSNPMACAVDKTITSPGSLNVALHLSAWTDRRMVGADVFDGFRIGFMSTKRSCLGEMLQWEGNHANATYCTRFFCICRFVISLVELNFPMLLACMKHYETTFIFPYAWHLSDARKCSWLLWLWVSVPLSQLLWEASCDLALMHSWFNWSSWISVSIPVNPWSGLFLNRTWTKKLRLISKIDGNCISVMMTTRILLYPDCIWLCYLCFWFEVEVSFGQTRFALELMMPRLYDTSSYSACFFASTFGTFDA